MTLMIRIPVATPSRPYEVLIGAGSLARAGEYLGGLLGNRRAFVVTVPPVRKCWGKVLLDSLSASGIETTLLEMPDGERWKRLATLEKLAEKLVQQGADRGAMLIAFGGGVVGDVTGFLASIYMRGVGVIQIPTTVVAQLDAAIGGKTGVNLQAGKNLLGTFHQPRAVLVDPLFSKRCRCANIAPDFMKLSNAALSETPVCSACSKSSIRKSSLVSRRSSRNSSPILCG